uniref:Phosphoglycolate phosphatase n=1 Tax=Nonomuraea gerenzanensis TaxID=93944 RepID=A0A1M4EI13_9ACTN|nr:Phosphoglycolate phosphatase [Nonomuraea gerenzanensis]
MGVWAQAGVAGVDERTISRQRQVRDDYYQEYLRTEAIEIEGVVEALAELSKYVRMAIVTTAKRADLELIHERRQIRQFMDFVVVREDYRFAKPYPEPYLIGLKRFGAAEEESTLWLNCGTSSAGDLWGGDQRLLCRAAPSAGGKSGPGRVVVCRRCW